MYARIVVLYDSSKHSDRALDAGIEYAKRFEAELTVFTVVPILPEVGEAPGVSPKAEQREVDAYRLSLENAADRARAAGARRVTTEMREGGVVEEILEYLDANRPDLVIVGSRGQSTGRRLVLGSVSEALVRHAPCPVLVQK